MTLVKFKRPNTLFPSIMDDFWKDFNDRETATFVPSVNVREQEDRYLLEMSAPGFDKKDISISVEDEVLTISGNVKEEKEERTENYVSREFRTGSFTRSFNLGKQIDAEHIAAKYENGILNVTLPKVETAVRKPKEIKVA